MADEQRPPQRGLSIPLPFEDALRAMLKVKPKHEDEASKKKPRKRRARGATSRPRRHDAAPES